MLYKISFKDNFPGGNPDNIRIAYVGGKNYLEVETKFFGYYEKERTECPHIFKIEIIEAEARIELD